MKGRLTLQQRLILPIILLGLISLLSNILAVFSINNIHANAGTIVDKSMVSEERLDEIRRSVMGIHRLALSHIVAADHATMIQLVQEIKTEEAALDERLDAYEGFVSAEDRETYQSLLNDYAQFKHALVYLVSASADSKTQEAYATANGDVARWGEAAEEDIDLLSASVSAQVGQARAAHTGLHHLPGHQRRHPDFGRFPGDSSVSDYPAVCPHTHSGHGEYAPRQLRADQRRGGRGAPAGKELQ